MQHEITLIDNTISQGKFLVIPWAEKYIRQERPQDCVLDWKFNGESIQGCAAPKGSKKETKSKTKKWCPTEANADGSYENGSGKFKFCYSK